MAVTFTGWTACDDPACPTLDWSSVETIRSKLHYVYYEAIRQAYVERLTAIGNTAQGWFATVNTPLEKGRCLLKSFLANMANARSGLFTFSGQTAFYADHTDSGGDWVNAGNGNCAPIWTAYPGIFNELGLVDDWNGDEFLSAEWLYEHYSILQLCRWIRGSIGTAVWGRFDAGDRTGKREGGGGGYTYSGMQADFAANSWQLLTTEIAQSYVLKYIEPDGYYGYAHRVPLYITNPYTGCDSEMDVYGYIAKASATFEYPPSGSAIENRYQLLDSLPAGSDAAVTVWVNDISAMDVTGDNSGWQLGRISPYSTTLNGVWVRKYDITGGFTFQ